MINGIRHGIERLAHGREFLTVILWKLDAEILLCDLLELKRHFLKRTESMHYGKKHDDRNCKQQQNAGEHIRRGNLIQQPENLYRWNADGASKPHSGSLTEQKIPAITDLSCIAGVAPRLRQGELLLRVQVQSAFR